MVDTATSAPSAAASVQIDVLRDGQTEYAGNGANGIYAWQAQVEQGPFASSIIADGDRASDQFVWPAASVLAESALRNRFAMQFIPEYSSDNAPNGTLAYFSSTPAIRIELASQVISVTDGSNTYAETARALNNARQLPRRPV